MYYAIIQMIYHLRYIAITRWSVYTSPTMTGHRMTTMSHRRWGDVISWPLRNSNTNPLLKTYAMQRNKKIIIIILLYNAFGTINTLASLKRTLLHNRIFWWRKEDVFMFNKYYHIINIIHVNWICNVNNTNTM